MTEHDDAAIEALRRLDRPHEPDARERERMRASVLDHFDREAEGVSVGPEPAGPGVPADTDVLELEPRTAERPRRVGWHRGLGAVAAAAVLLVGALVLVEVLGSDGRTVTRPPVTIDEQRLAEQLEVYCAEFIVSLHAADDLWFGRPGEAQDDMLLALEQAFQGIADLGPPASVEFAGARPQLGDLVTDARRAATLRGDADREISAARDAIFAEVAEATARLADADARAPSCAAP